MTPNLFALTGTLLFAGSFFAASAVTLKKLQAGTACLWILYGIAIEAPPLVVASLVVGAAAALSGFHRLAWKEEWSARIKAGRAG